MPIASVSLARTALLSSAIACSCGSLAVNSAWDVRPSMTGLSRSKAGAPRGGVRGRAHPAGKQMQEQCRVWRTCCPSCALMADEAARNQVAGPPFAGHPSRSCTAPGCQYGERRPPSGPKSITRGFYARQRQLSYCRSARGRHRAGGDGAHAGHPAQGGGDDAGPEIPVHRGARPARRTTRRPANRCRSRPSSCARRPTPSCSAPAGCRRSAIPTTPRSCRRSSCASSSISMPACGPAGSFPACRARSSARPSAASISSSSASRPRACSPRWARAW